MVFPTEFEKDSVVFPDLSIGIWKMEVKSWNLEVVERLEGLGPLWEPEHQKWRRDNTRFNNRDSIQNHIL